ncbi:MAG: UDP-N-acetylmuramoyl-tripeptide--D-alanyl-D-alanine ligase [Bacteroidales bacterium]|nr:UDP-N-acetylmuramoyl-tripeptide--D-alanyl-D-alanine ligase [Bacteroidales bacterium]
MLEKLYEQFLAHPQVCTDTRHIIPNSIFFCLKGENFDGNDFALKALEEGAAFVVTTRKDLASNPRCLVCDDTLFALQMLAKQHRIELKTKIIGITGTNGKTTTKELTAAVLSKGFRITYTQGNLNNHIGVPLTLLSIKPDDELAIVEMGANHPGEIAELCSLSMPNMGVITNIGTAHIEGFRSKDNIISTKKALYTSVLGRCGLLFVNKDDELLYNKLYEYNSLYYSTKDENAHVFGKIVNNDGFLTVEIFGRTVKTHLTGAYNLNNILAACAIGKYFQIDEELICEAIASYSPANQRSQMMHCGTNTIIADYYNANPTSMAAALENLLTINHGHRIAILGEMRELGEISVEEHARIVDFCHKNHIETYFVGNEFLKHLPNGNNVFANVDEANEYFAKNRLDNAMILVKGSRGVHLEKLSFLQ